MCGFSIIQYDDKEVASFSTLLHLKKKGKKEIFELATHNILFSKSVYNKHLECCCPFGQHFVDAFGKQSPTHFEKLNCFNWSKWLIMRSGCKRIVFSLN